jgi:antirestriction protein ArdC
VDTKERKQRLARALTGMLEKEGVLTLLKLRSSASLRRFSLGNIIGLMFQAEMKKKPMPTMLHTYKDWLALDRQVMKGEGGENAWHVLAPNKQRVWKDKDDHSQGKRSILVGWFSMSQFDVTQTSGPPLAELDAPELTSDDHMEALVSLIDWCAEQNRPVVFDITGNSKGWWTPSEDSITISQEPEADEQLAILIHECIHAHCNINYKDFSQSDAEMITESATAIVCMGLDLDHIQQSIEYVLAWSCDDPEKAVTLLDKAEQCAAKLEVATGLRVPYQKREKVAA